MTCNNVHQKWPIYQEFFFCMCMYTNVRSWTKMAQLSGMFIYPVVHLHISAYMFCPDASALYLVLSSFSKSSLPAFQRAEITSQLLTTSLTNLAYSCSWHYIEGAGVLKQYSQASLKELIFGGYLICTIKAYSNHLPFFTPCSLPLKCPGSNLEEKCHLCPMAGSTTVYSGPCDINCQFLL